MAARAHHYPELPPSPQLAAIEEEILDRWAADKTFEASVEQRTGAEYVFYDGPPFANGLPHYGHLLTGFVKDAVPRYQTMRGKRVVRRFGWDCHGLPAEMEAEKELGLPGRAAILAFGVDRFNAHCRESVQRYTREWERYVTRQGRWVDFDNDYRTMDLPYMESVLWAFKSLYDKELVYEGYRVLPYCWECETPLSNFETRMDDAYRDRQDPALTVAFDLLAADRVGGAPTRLLAWTTTPWTLPSNLALVVGADLDYAVLALDGVHYVVGEARLAAYANELEGARQVATLKGSDLVGRRYEPLFGFFAGQPQAFLVLAGDFVTTEDGTGIVHTAPGFGEDDQRVAEDHGIAVVCPVDDQGRFTAEVGAYAGLQVFDANRPIIRDLAARGHVVREDSFVHSYPHCWRTDTPLIYKAVSSWFVAVTSFKDRLLANNQHIHWVPEHVKDGAFGKWLEGARDWSISRNRFWGAPIPVWRSDDPARPRVDVYGSLDEIERDFGVRPTDLHLPAIDQLTRPNPDDPTGASTMRRVPEVLDCWFESGSMPYAQVHYPFENVEWFESHFPADFIVEYIGQTRGWFYTLHVLATALFDTHPFRTCLAHGVILGDDGRKASKRLRNFPDPDVAFAQYGADAIRWSLLSSSVLRGGNLIVSDKGMGAAVREAVLPVWNACHFFTTYANTAGRRAVWRADSTNALDRYVLAKTHDLVASVTARMDACDLAGACADVSDFLDALNNWYVRRSRDRFWGTGTGTGTGTGSAGRPSRAGQHTEPDADAVDTLYTVLEVLLRTVAPLLPFIGEYLYTALTGARSVHLTDWPDVAALPADPGLVAVMDRVREVCSAGLSLRKAGGLRVRLPLPSLTVAGDDAAALQPFVGLIGDEVNVKEVRLVAAVSDAGDVVLSVLPRVAGPRLGGRVQEVLRAAKAGAWKRSGDGVEVGGIALRPGEFTLSLVPRDESTTRALPGLATLVVLDTSTTAELEAEGMARDVVREVQQARRTAALDVGDRIRLRLVLPQEQAAAVESHREWVTGEVLAVEMTVTAGAPPSIEVTKA